MYSRRNRSSPPRSHTSSQSEVKIKDIFDALIQGNYTSAIEKMKEFKIRGTKISAYRKIHFILTETIDKIMASRDSQKDLQRIAAQLLKAGIMIEYQAKRGYVHNGLANGLVEIINKIISDLQNLQKPGRDFEQIKRKAEALKIIIDGLLAFHMNEIK